MAAKNEQPLNVECPKCGAKIGTRCRNYHGSVCAPHRARMRPEEVPVVRKVKPVKPVQLSLFEEGGE